MIALRENVWRASQLPLVKGENMAEPKLARDRNIVPAQMVIGNNVVNADYEEIGKIEDLALDASAGRIAYAVLSFGGFLGMGDKYFAVPWNAFSFNLPMSRVVLNVEKKLLEKAPGFDKDNWPNMADATWGTGIHKHYGLTPYWEEDHSGW
jgi:sporulation protein YlmC with PRC-barrel domain